VTEVIWKLLIQIFWNIFYRWERFSCELSCDISVYT